MTGALLALNLVQAPLFLVMTSLDCWSGEWERRTKEAAGRAKSEMWGHWEAREREATAGGKEAQRRNPVPEGNQSAAQGHESCPTHTSTSLIIALPILTSWHSSHNSGPAGRDLHTKEVTVVFVLLWSGLFLDLLFYLIKFYFCHLSCRTVSILLFPSSLLICVFCLVNFRCLDVFALINIFTVWEVLPPHHLVSEK